MCRKADAQVASVRSCAPAPECRVCVRCVCMCVCVCVCDRMGQLCVRGEWEKCFTQESVIYVLHDLSACLSFIHVLYDLSACLSLGGTMGSHVIFSSCIFFVDIVCLLVVAWNHGNCVIKAVERLRDAKKKKSDIGHIFSWVLGIAFYLVNVLDTDFRDPWS